MEYTTYRIVDNVPTLTGVLNMNVLEYLYGDPSIATTAFQIMVRPTSGYGPALSASVSGRASAVSGCRFSSASFPSQALRPLGGGYHSGESYFDSTATAPGAKATCTSRWNLTITNPGHPPAGAGSYTEGAFRCDNATVGRSTPGCVIPWSAEWLVYRSIDTPALASHVSRAQASGLPGAPGGTPLIRTTNKTTIKTNRNRACYQRPSIAGKSCDEYPVATSREGLASLSDTAWKKARRTFPGCKFNLPKRTGAVGASACMISAREQSSQGGTNNGFYQEWRVLDGDPFYVDVE